MNFTLTTSISATLSHKIVFLGDTGVGKTSIVERIADGRFHSDPQTTVVMDFVRKNVMHGGITRKLNLWDTAGQEKFSSLVPSSIRKSDCAVIVYDITRPQTLYRLEAWLKMLQQNSSANSPILLVANKMDLGRKNNTIGFQLAVKHGMNYLEVSACTGKGIEALLLEILDSIDNAAKEEASTQVSTQKTVEEAETGPVQLKKNSHGISLKNTGNSCCSI